MEIFFKHTEVKNSYFEERLDSNLEEILNNIMLFTELKSDQLMSRNFFTA